MSATVANPTQTLIEQLAENERLFKETGFMYGMKDLKRKA